MEFIHQIAVNPEVGCERFYYMNPEGVIVNYDSSQVGKTYITLYGHDENIASAENRIKEGVSALELSI